ncbi:hypothetical protein DRQ50_10625 [bacterium]|nr:MAG: hypothetical protein DRQ50_10625 [bacterium]
MSLFFRLIFLAAFMVILPSMLIAGAPGGSGGDAMEPGAAGVNPERRCDTPPIVRASCFSLPGMEERLR